MMLKSKASKNEDRFYSIFPLFAEYKNKLKSKDQVDSWKIGSILSVKLKLYELMNTKDKLDLLFLSGKDGPSLNSGQILPTFATSTISWEGALQYKGLLQYRDDLTYDFNITLHQTKNTSDDVDSHLYYLHLKPLVYYMTSDCRTDATVTRNVLQEKKAVCKRLHFDDPNETIEMVCIPNNREGRPSHDHGYFDDDDHFIYLIGSFQKNKWILGRKSYIIKGHDYNWTCHDITDNNAGFNVY